MVGVLVSSDREFFNKLSPEQQREFFKTAYDYVAERYGRENIVAARVHMDETTPHMHLHLVPLTADGRLSAKELFDRKTYSSFSKNFPCDYSRPGLTFNAAKAEIHTKRPSNGNANKPQKSLLNYVGPKTSCTSKRPSWTAK